MPHALIVEDEPEANRLLAMLVQLRGYRTSSAFNGREALERVRAEPPDIVFLDLMLPDVNGYEVCRRLKSVPATCLIPVVMVTARVEAENRRQCFGLGADEYVPKPYTPDQIFGAMADADHWRQHLARDGSEGEIRLRSAGDEALRQLARLRNLLVARTPLETEAACRIADALRELWSGAASRATADRREVAATLRYRLGDGDVLLTLGETSGWLTDDRPAVADCAQPPLSPGPFDECHLSDDGGTLTLLRRYPDSGSSGGVS